MTNTVGPILGHFVSSELAVLAADALREQGLNVNVRQVIVYQLETAGNLQVEVDEPARGEGTSIADDDLEVLRTVASFFNEGQTVNVYTARACTLYHFQLLRRGQVFAEWYPTKGKSVVHVQSPEGKRLVRGPKCSTANALIAWLKNYT